MGVANNTDFADDFEELDTVEDFSFLDENEQPRTRRNKLAWRSVEDYLADKRLKEELSDVFDDDWYA